MMTSHASYETIGKTIATGWGIHHNGTYRELLESLNDGKLLISLIAHLITEVKETNRKLGALLETQSNMQKSIDAINAANKKEVDQQAMTSAIAIGFDKLMRRLEHKPDNVEHRPHDMRLVDMPMDGLDTRSRKVIGRLIDDGIVRKSQLTQQTLLEARDCGLVTAEKILSWADGMAAVNKQGKRGQTFGCNIKNFEAMIPVLPYTGEKPHLLLKDMDKTGLSTRARKVLVRLQKCLHVELAEQLTEEMLLQCKNCGYVTAKEILGWVQNNQ